MPARAFAHSSDRRREVSKFYTIKAYLTCPDVRFATSVSCSVSLEHTPSWDEVERLIWKEAGDVVMNEEGDYDFSLSGIEVHMSDGPGHCEIEGGSFYSDVKESFRANWQHLKLELFVAGHMYYKAGLKGAMLKDIDLICEHKPKAEANKLHIHGEMTPEQIRVSIYNYFSLATRIVAARSGENAPPDSTLNLINGSLAVKNTVRKPNKW